VEDEDEEERQPGHPLAPVAASMADEELAARLGMWLQTRLQ
jgi:hypothetical protein